MSGIFRFAALSHDQLRVMCWNCCGMDVLIRIRKVWDKKHILGVLAEIFRLCTADCILLDSGIGTICGWNILCQYESGI